MITTVTRVTIHPEGSPINDEMAYVIEIGDGVGADICVELSAYDGAVIRIDYTDWPALRHAIDEMVEQCRKLDNAGKD